MNKATFNLRIDTQLKARFQKKLEENQETATEVITRAIEAYCNDVTIDSNDATETVTTSSNDNCNDTATDQTQQELEQLKAEMGGLRQQLETMQGKVVHQFKQIEAGKIDRSDLQGLSCDLPSQIAPQAPEKQQEEQSEEEEVDIKPQTPEHPQEHPQEQSEEEKAENDIAKIKDLIRKDEQKWKTIATLTGKQQAQEISNFLIQHDFKPSGYKITNPYLSFWIKPEKRPKNPTGNHYLAFIVWINGIYPYVNKK